MRKVSSTDTCHTYPIISTSSLELGPQSVQLPTQPPAKFGLNSIPVLFKSLYERPVNAIVSSEVERLGRMFQRAMLLGIASDAQEWAQP